MPVPNESVVRQVLAQHERDARIRVCIEEAWNSLKSKYDERAKWRRKSTTRALMWENSIGAVVSEFDGDEGVKAIGHHDTMSFIADDTVLFRLKKANSTLFSTNYPTPLAGLFHAHREDLFGHEGHHRVEVVHVFNRFQTALEWIGVVARNKRRVLWQFELPERGASVSVLPLPISPLRPAADTVLRPVAADSKKKNNEPK